MAANRNKQVDAWIGLLVFVGVLAVYVATLCPTVYPGPIVPGGAPLGESLRAVTVATKTSFVWSVEYPLWRFLARFFMAVSANKAWALNLFSAIFGAGAIGLLYRVFARFGHTRTRDELIRFRGQPGLARYAAVAAALLVAFSHTFWRASVEAGTYTLNAFLLVLATHLLLCCKETRKKRYFILYGVVYAVSLANFPTMLLLLPVFVVLSVLWCPEVYRDWVTLGLTALVGAILLAIAAFQGPIGYTSNLPVYYVKPLPVTRTMFDYIRWYWSQIRPVLPIGGLAEGLRWLLWLVLPTLPPVVYLAFTKPQRRTEMGRGSTISDNIFTALAFLYTLFGLMVLFDFVIGPHAFLGRQGFLVAYMVTGGWVCYMLGYWAVLFTGTRSAAAAPGRPRYAKGAYTFLVAVFLILPVASAVKHAQVDESGLAGFTALEDLAKDTLTSAASVADEESGNRVLLVVTDPWGDLLRYVHGRLSKALPSEVVLLDLFGADHSTLYVDKHAYLSELLVGRQLPAEGNPARAPGMSDAEAVVQYIGMKGSPVPKICATGDVDRYSPESENLDYIYEFVPCGLVYLLDRRDHFLNVPAEHVAAGRELWSRLRTSKMEPRPLNEWPPLVASMMMRASKLSNDFGVYCHKYAGEQEAVGFYNQALRYDPANYAALRNLKIAGVDLGPELDLKISNASMDFNDSVDKSVRAMLGPGEAESKQETMRKYAAALRLMSVHGLVRDTTVIEDFYQANPNRRSRSYAFSYAVICLGALVEPEGESVLAERGQLYVQTATLGRVEASIAQTVRALKDLQTGAPYVEEGKKAEVQYWIAEAYRMLNRPEEAEVALKRAIEMRPDYTQASMRLAGLYMARDRKDEALAIAEDLIARNPPKTRDELVGHMRMLRSYYMGGETPDPEGFLERARAYAESNPGQALNTLLFLFDSALGDEDFAAAGEFLAEMERRYESPSVVRLRKAQLALAEKRYADVLAIEPDPNDPLEPEDRVRWHMMRGDAYLQQGDAVHALEELEVAHGAHEAFVRTQFREAADRFEGNEEALRENERRLRIALDNVDLQHSYGLWYAAVQVAGQQDDPALTGKALDYARLYQGRYAASNLVPDQRKLEATAHYGWTLFKLQGDTRSAQALIEPIVIGVPSEVAAKVYYGAVLVADGEIERGLSFLKEALNMELPPYERGEAEALLEKYKDYVPEQPEEPETPVETEDEDAPVAPEGVTVETEAEEPGPETESDSPTAE